jgi:uncharacterized membrane protein
MRKYIIKASLLALLLLVSVWVGVQITQVQISPISYVGILYLVVLFILVRYFTYHDTNISENKKIRRFMIGSMVRLFLVLIFLAISLFNMKPIQFTFVVVFGLTFLFFLFFDILEMRTNLRPDSEKSNKNSNV